MRILVTGANGFIGRNIVECLSRSHIVYGCGRSLPNGLNTRYYMCDLLKGVPDVEVDVIVHAAACAPSPSVCFQEYFNNNVVATSNILKYARKQKVKKIIYLGAVSSYGVVDKVLREDSPHNNPNAYGLTKYVAERLIMDSDIPYYILILPGVVGERCRDNWIIRSALSLCYNERLVYYNGHGLFNNIVEVKDLCIFLKKLLESDSSVSETYLLGSMEKMIVNDVVRYLKERLASASYLECVEENHNSFYLDTSKAVSAGFQSQSLMNTLDLVCNEALRRLQDK